ncbi:hypothetical protein L2E82_48893 [Cichorium intybus]|uniref:Uncharacterized protein n=1 Tax=Cichorium intybus TaxID=13427 RepID=A0ACB8YY44_CICIN|nr:hypothetical protein L2E82_48893 [Cichorium intybus]
MSMMANHRDRGGAVGLPASWNVPMVCGGKWIQYWGCKQRWTWDMNSWSDAGASVGDGDIEGESWEAEEARIEDEFRDLCSGDDGRGEAEM